MRRRPPVATMGVLPVRLRQLESLPAALALNGKAVADRLAQVVSLVSRHTGATSGEVRLFVSSLERAALIPRQWLARARCHWQVETGNHHRRDITRREDEERGRKPRRACNLALLRSALLGARLRDDPCNLSALTQHYAFHPAAALRFLLSPHAQP